MLATYGVDVLDPAVSCRRVRVLLDRLPPAARQQGQEWSTEAELLATVIDALGQLTYVTLRANGAKCGKPKPVKRPSPARRVTRDANRYTHDALPAAQNGATRAGSWAEAAAVLAGLPGVTVTHG
jgi:hypothetical protein